MFIGPPTRFWKWRGGGGGLKIRGLGNILAVDKMSLDVLESDIKASSPENIHYRHNNFIEVTFCH